MNKHICRARPKRLPQQDCIIIIYRTSKQCRPEEKKNDKEKFQGKKRKWFIAPGESITPLLAGHNAKEETLLTESLSNPSLVRRRELARWNYCCRSTGISRSRSLKREIRRQRDSSV